MIEAGGNQYHMGRWKGRGDRGERIEKGVARAKMPDGTNERKSEGK
jgi:hypothetical protein